MPDHDKVTPIPAEPELSMSEVIQESLLAKGYEPTLDDVAHIIAERGRWGDPPKVAKCKACGWPVFHGQTHCDACNSPQDTE